MTFRAYITKSLINMGVGGVGSILTFPNISSLGYIRFMQKTKTNAPIPTRCSLERFANVRLLHQLRFALQGKPTCRLCSFKVRGQWDVTKRFLQAAFLAYFSTMKIVSVHSCYKSAKSPQNTQHHIPDDSTAHSGRYKNLKSTYNFKSVAKIVIKRR
jgi:hypothetical protein